MKIKKFLWGLIPAYNEYIYYLSKRYVDRFDNNNNDNPLTNGELRLMRKLLPKSKCVFDVGANVGNWARMAVQINPEVFVHCFEPSPTTFTQLAEKVLPANVIKNNAGLGSASKTTVLHVFEDNAGHNSLYRRNGMEDGWGLKAQAREESIRLIALNDYVIERNISRIDLMKIDVEGHELEVLRGASNLLTSGDISYIQFEYGGCNIDSCVLLKDLFEFLMSYGYKLHKIYPESLKPVLRYDQRMENFHYQNWLAISPKVVGDVP